MAIIRTASYTVIPTATMEDRELSWSALGFLIFLLSDRSNNHEMSPHERDVIMPELIKTGYVIEKECGNFDVFDIKQDVKGEQNA